jgi:hypothetical protein
MERDRTNQATHGYLEQSLFEGDESTFVSRMSGN